MNLSNRRRVWSGLVSSREIRDHFLDLSLEIFSFPAQPEKLLNCFFNHIA